MTDDTYKQSLRKAKVELIEALRERERLNLKIARLDQLVKALSATEEKPALQIATEEALTNPVGFSELVLTVVNRSSQALSPKQVKDTLVVFGYDLSRYANPSAMIHQTLKRLADQHKIEALHDGTYKRSPLYEALLNTTSAPVPNPLGKTLSEMLKETGKKK